MSEVKAQAPMMYALEQVALDGESKVALLRGLTDQDKDDLRAWAEVEMTAKGLPIKETPAK